MRISLDSFQNGGEVDCGAHHKDGRRAYRLTLRLNPRTGLIEAYKKYHDTKEEEVVKTGSGPQVLRWLAENYALYKDDRWEGPESQEEKS